MIDTKKLTPVGRGTRAVVETAKQKDSVFDKSDRANASGKASDHLAAKAAHEEVAKALSARAASAKGATAMRLNNEAMRMRGREAGS
jgi:hypothetical protein